MKTIKEVFHWKRIIASQADCYKTIRAAEYLLVALGFGFISWIAIMQLVGWGLLLVLVLGLVPHLVIVRALRKASTIKLSLAVLAVSAALIVWACYILFDAFFIHISSLNSILLVQMPVIQLLIAFCIYLFVHFRTRKREHALLRAAFSARGQQEKRRV